MVIGYGVQKKSVVTASIARVGAEELGPTASTRVDNVVSWRSKGAAAIRSEDPNQAAHSGTATSKCSQAGILTTE